MLLKRWQKMLFVIMIIKCLSDSTIITSLLHPAAKFCFDTCLANLNIFPGYFVDFFKLLIILLPHELFSCTEGELFSCTEGILFKIMIFKRKCCSLNPRNIMWEHPILIICNCFHINFLST